MIENVLWIAVALMVISSILPKRQTIRNLIGGLGWGFFSIHWAYKTIHYIEKSDYANVVLMLIVTVFCLMLAHFMIKEYKQNVEPGPGNSDSINVASIVTGATAIGALFYFPFAEIPMMNTWIITEVTDQVMWMLDIFSKSAVRESWDMISLNGYRVQIILACTAIESIALFTGLIISVNAPTKRLLSALLVSLPVIYGLNLIRDVFVIIAYGEQWFGANSFEVAHHIIAKAGSGIALFFIAYAVLKILPELLDLIDGLWKLITEQLRNVVRKVTGNH
ncbi:MAG TPA: archaeosortase A [Methanosarcinaceae archaeon]|nr:archaeosortase A [Methanosarcinaceae archaeon]